MAGDPKVSQTQYQLLDSGNGEKLERFGPYILRRPCSQAVWKTQHPKLWSKADASFQRNAESQEWTGRHTLADEWELELHGLRLKLSATDFGHLGVFPEHGVLWSKIEEQLASRPGARFLNLFAYSGAASLVAARAGAEVCHVDSSRGMVAWARENAAKSGLEDKPIRWIVDDCIKFLARELRRERKYDAILLDPPSFGRGAKGEVFKIEEGLPILLEHCKALLSDDPLFVILSCHSPGYTPTILANLLRQSFGSHVQQDELFLTGQRGIFDVPCGAYARWIND